jgi:hypothetical protein
MREFTHIHLVDEAISASRPTHRLLIEILPTTTSTPCLKRKRDGQISHGRFKANGKTEDHSVSLKDPLLSQLPHFLQLLLEWRVILCTTHRGCYTRQNISRHLLEKYNMRRNER